MAQLIKCLPCMYEDLSLNPTQRAGHGDVPCNPMLGKESKPLGLWPASQSRLLRKLQVREIPCFRKQSGELIQIHGCR